VAKAHRSELKRSTFVEHEFIEYYCKLQSEKLVESPPRHENTIGHKHLSNMHDKVKLKKKLYTKNVNGRLCGLKS